MKVLILIHSCVKFALDGSNQASRNTFLKDVAKFPNLDYKFFLGDGTPTGEDEDAMQSSLRDCPHVRLDNPRISLEDPNQYMPKEDEVVLHVPDDYIYMVWKFKEAVRWAVERDYDYIFKASGDTYIDIPRLMSSGFENHAYIGRKYGNFGVGGSGYWLSKETAKLLLAAKVDDWAEDRWVGHTVLLPLGVVIHGDQRYGASPQQNPGLSNPSPLFPEEGNEQITAHLAEAPGHYHYDLMYKAHEIRHTPQPPAVPAQVQNGVPLQALTAAPIRPLRRPPR